MPFTSLSSSEGNTSKAARDYSQPQSSHRPAPRLFLASCQARTRQAQAFQDGLDAVYRGRRQASEDIAADDKSLVAYRARIPAPRRLYRGRDSKTCRAARRSTAY